MAAPLQTSLARADVRRRPTLVRLFEVEPELLDGIPQRQLEVITERVVVTCHSWSAGGVSPGSTAAKDASLCILLSGLLTRRVESCGRRSVELLGGGDVFSPREDANADGASPAQWYVHGHAELAVLDAQWVEAMARWPQVTGSLLDRMALRSARLIEQLAISQMRELDRRVLCLLWLLAQRWGTVGVSGVSLSLPVDHEMLAALVSAQRPSVTTSLRRLREQGLIARVGRGQWDLHGAPPPELGWSAEGVVAMSAD